MTGDVQNGRVTTAQFYEQQLKTQEQLTEMERRIMVEIKPLSKMCLQVETNTKEIDTLRKRSNVIDGINALVAVVSASIAAFFGRAP